LLQKVELLQNEVVATSGVAAEMLLPIFDEHESHEVQSFQ
jgi:hypothetical protein